MLTTASSHLIPPDFNAAYKACNRGVENSGMASYPTLDELKLM